MTGIADLLDDDTVTKITNLKITNVDLVDQAANGRQFILRKSADETNPSIFGADEVREFAKQAQEGDMTDSAPEPVVKADEEILEDAPASADGDPDEPGSPAWEAIDAATAWAQLSMLTDVKRALDALADRESVEAFNGDEDGFDNAWDLQTACELVDAAIAVVAPYAVGEQSESEQVEKAALEPREVLSGFVKAGRSLSSANESALRGAAAAIQNVLASLPAPVEDVAKGADVAADGGTIVVNVAPKVDPEAVVKAVEDLESVVKAKSDPQVLVYDENGSVIGSVDPANLTTFANSAAPAPEAPADAPSEGAPADAPAADAPAEPVADVAADASPDAAVIPGTDTVQSPVETDDTNVTKAAVTEAADAFKEALAPIVKKLEENSELALLVKSLQERVDQFGRTPDDRHSPLLNGSVGTAGQVARDGQVDELAPLRKAVEDAPLTKKVEAQSALAFAAIKSRFQQ